MREVDRSSTFRRDYKRELKRSNQEALDGILVPVLKALVNDQPLAKNHRDHRLTGNWDGYRECHLKPDLLLIYKKPDRDTLRLARMGTHSELFS